MRFQDGIQEADAATDGIRTAYILPVRNTVLADLDRAYGSAKAVRRKA